MKMYLLIKDDVPTEFALVAASHGPLAMYLKYQNDEDVQTWANSIFYKVICKVTPEEFERAKKYDDKVIITESALCGEEVAIAFKPRKDELWSKFFKFLKKWSPNPCTEIQL